MKSGSVYKRCSCRNPETGKQYGKNCPKAKKKGHGSWSVKQELPPADDGTRRYFRRTGYDAQDKAQTDLDHVRSLLAVAKNDRQRNQVAEMLSELSKNGDELPDAERVQRMLKHGTRLRANCTVGEWLDIWMPRQKHLARSTVRNYQGHIDDYLKPNLGEIEVDELSVSDVVEMFEEIEKENERISANNDDRHALLARIKMAPTSPRSIRRKLREELAALPPFRKPAGPSTRNRIKATLRKALNDMIAHEGLITFNPAHHVHLADEKPRPLLWTPERVEEWRRTGRKPSPVMVWTPALTGEFLDGAADDPLYGLYHLALYRGPRRGELCALDETDVATDFRSVNIDSQLTEVDYEVEESTPKTEAGTRTVGLDHETGQALRWQVERNRRNRLRWGDAWVDSGRLFTEPNGEQLRPSAVSDRFERLVALLGLPPIRFHDCRHVAATLMLAGGADMKVVQTLLGHASLSVTADLYTSVLPELALSAAEAAAALVPRSRRPTAGLASVSLTA
ncbi:tyrosine-type recombinase/integrase [Saccharopolyspora shandongensis]|uniref:tyrosine-type recombinase/integrase n=1 Tax=Saccharopolyspora shandongensis TaxID=418495 RepID=UPI0034068D88